MSKLGNYAKEHKKIRNERRRVCIKWFWTDHERWLCYRKAKKGILFNEGLDKNQAFLMVQEASKEELKKMYKKR